MTSSYPRNLLRCTCTTERHGASREVKDRSLLIVLRSYYLRSCRAFQPPPPLPPHQGESVVSTNQPICPPDSTLRCVIERQISTSAAHQLPTNGGIAISGNMRTLFRRRCRRSPENSYLSPALMGIAARSVSPPSEYRSSATRSFHSGVLLSPRRYPNAMRPPSDNTCIEIAHLSVHVEAHENPVCSSEIV